MSEITNIDWSAVRTRLQVQQDAFDKALKPTAERLQKVHAQRASELSARVAAAEHRDETWPGLIFKLGRERFCLALSTLAEVFSNLKCTPVPGGPPELSGMVNVRGEVCSVLDLARLLDIPPVEERPAGYLLLARRPGALIALRVDAVEKIEVISPATLTRIEGAATASGSVRLRTASRATVLEMEELLLSYS